jgi:small multidrug resistance family-3 protein
MREFMNQLVATRAGTLGVLLLAAFLEVYGDSCFQQGIHRTGGGARYAVFALGALTLACYGLVVNTPPWDFGKLLGLYVVLFFLVAQALAKIRFQQSPTLPIVVGGALIVSGGAVIMLWKP